MAYDYIGLVNDCAKRLNETELTSSNFSTATGFYPAIKEAVNSAIRHINQSHFAWSFNHNVEEIDLEAGVTRYALVENLKYVDFGSFRVQRNETLNLGEGRRLPQITYAEYLDKYIDQEYETDTSKGSAPRYIARTPNEEFAVVPMPNAEYTIEYEYYMEPVDLSLATDIPTIPERFRHIIVDGAMYYTYMFRDNIEMANLSQSKFDDGIKNMRTLLVNEYAYFRAS
jgi:hypothetical protein